MCVWCVACTLYSVHTTHNHTNITIPLFIVIFVVRNGFVAVTSTQEIAFKQTFYIECVTRKCALKPLLLFLDNTNNCTPCTHYILVENAAGSCLLHWIS